MDVLVQSTAYTAATQGSDSRALREESYTSLREGVGDGAVWPYLYIRKLLTTAADGIETITERGAVACRRIIVAALDEPDILLQTLRISFRSRSVYRDGTTPFLAILLTSYVQFAYCCVPV